MAEFINFDHRQLLTNLKLNEIFLCPIFIVLNEVDQKIDRWIRDIAWEVGFKNERVITTVLLDKVQFEHGPMSESTIVDNVLREGISA